LFDELFTQLAALTAIPGPSGAEGPVAEWLMAELAGHELEARVDRAGNVIVCSGRRPTGLISAHMDQVGFMVSRLEADGATCLPVGEPELEGPCSVTVTGAGAGNAAERGSGRLHPGGDQDAPTLRCDLPVLEVGDRVTFSGALARRADGRWEGPALDNRIGCCVLLALALELGHMRPEVAFVWTVREEIGGAGVLGLARRLKPTWAVSLDVTPAGSDRHGDSDVQLGHGPAITLMDEGTVVDGRLLAALLEVAGAQEIPVQREVVSDGISEAGIVESQLGIPALALLVPVERPHSPRECADPVDIEATRALLAAALDEVG